MTTMQLAGRDLAFNRQGFLASFEHWDPQVAAALAEDEGLTLTDCHWRVIEFLRDYYATHDIPPSPRVVIRTIGAEISAHVPCTRRHLNQLFPDGGCRQACRIAGLPRHYCHGC